MFKFSRILVAYLFAIPLALILGYLAVSPGKFTFTVVGLTLFFFALPLLLKWHHVLMVIFWSSAFSFPFLPGQPDAWVVFGALSFGISFLNHILFQKKFLHAPELTRPLLFLAAVVLVTAWYRGGIGIRAFGGAAYGGKYYYWILLAIAGYFAFTAEQIPMAKSGKMAGLYFLSGSTYALSNIVYKMGPAFFFLYYFLPSGYAIDQASADYGYSTIDRIAGLAPACQAGLCFLLARYGIRGMFDMSSPWRLAVLLVTVGASFFAGFRAAIMMLFLIFAFQFYFEGLLRTHLFPILVGLAICGFVPILFFANKMPNSVQRAVSFLPVNVDSEVLLDAKSSSDWRFEMWALVAKEIPKYLIIGKGYSIDPSELAMVSMAAQLGVETTPYEGQLIAGDYHSGPLSVIMPFGILGVVAFFWVLIAGYRVLSSNYRYGDARLRRTNTTLLAVYVAQCISFFILFGAFNSQLFIFLGTCGFSVSLNGGVRRRAVPRPAPVPVQHTLAMEPG